MPQLKFPPGTRELEPLIGKNKASTRYSLSEATAPELDFSTLMGDPHPPVSHEAYSLWLRTPNLRDLYLKTSFGLAISLQRLNGSFFQNSVDDTAWRLSCPTCFAPLQPLNYTQAEFVCFPCGGMPSVWFTSKADNNWFSPAAAALEVEKAEVRKLRSKGQFKVLAPERVKEFALTNDSIDGLVKWIEPLSDPFQAHVLAWDLAPKLETIWKAWKIVNRRRKIETKLSYYRAIENYWTDPAGTAPEGIEWANWPVVELK